MSLKEFIFGKWEVVQEGVALCKFAGAGRSVWEETVAVEVLVNSKTGKKKAFMTQLCGIRREVPILLVEHAKTTGEQP